MRDTQISRDKELSRALYDEHADALLAYVQRLVQGDRQMAENVAQETMLRAWQRIRELPAEARRPWLFTTARQLIIGAYRARKARPAETSSDLLHVAVEDDGLDSALDAVLLTEALQALSAEHRSVLFDCCYPGNAAAQIAAARGLPPGTVRSRIHYALRALRLALQERGVSGI